MSPLVGLLRSNFRLLALLQGLAVPLAGRVPLLGEDLDGILELGRLLIEGQLILLNGALSLRKLQLRDDNPTSSMHRQSRFISRR